MKIDLEHIHFWMSAIRESKNPYRTLDAFWKGQINSKIWLIDTLKEFVKEEVTVDIHGGWVGVLSSLLFQSELPIRAIRSIDIDSECEEISIMMNKVEEMQGRYSAITQDMCKVQSNADVVINTSCEHISQQAYNQWISKIPKTSLVVLQSNNYHIPEHIRIAESLEEFESQSNINVQWKGEFETPLYTRWMLIGKI